MRDSIIRSRFISLVSYSDPLIDLSSLLDKSLYYCYILHDRDLLKDGSPAVPHYHCLLYLKNPIVCGNLSRYSATHQNVFCEPVYDKGGSFRYLTHQDNPDKFQYDSSSIVSNNIKYFSSDDVYSRSGESTMQLIDDINLHLPYRILVLRYGRDLVRNWISYKSFADMVRQQESCPDDIDF